MCAVRIMCGCDNEWMCYGKRNQKARGKWLQRVLKEYGIMFGSPFFLEYNDAHELPYRVEINNNGHYFPTEQDACSYAEGEIAAYYKKHPRRKSLR